jgi:hypothetical protein
MDRYVVLKVQSCHLDLDYLAIGISGAHHIIMIVPSVPTIYIIIYDKYVHSMLRSCRTDLKT